MKLGVNVDHVATLRQQRQTRYPDPVVCSLLAEYAGCDSIVMHLREDRRHIQERDLRLVKKAIPIPLNLEMSVAKEIVEFALRLKPYQATLVPEKRKELTTEGGLDLVKNYNKVKKVVERLQSKGIRASLFIDPRIRQIKYAKKIGASNIEIHTGKFCDAKTVISKKNELTKIKEAANFAKKIGFFVAAGHGIDYENVKPIAKIKAIEELNIGHSIICRSVAVGIVPAVEEMVGLLGKKR
ncbi:MAG: pyridoxine 5'-phosphate synthase [Candidatus Omnitrophica bacterium]|nr:pyridoxine 5'-phosphate synthase [Candidatus Omnitrophota bacterium]